MSYFLQSRSQRIVAVFLVLAVATVAASALLLFGSPAEAGSPQARMNQAVSDHNDDDFNVRWSHADGCVDEIVIGRIEAWLAIEFDNGEVGYDTADNLRGTATSATFDLSPWEHLKPVGDLFEVYLHPENRVYGGEYYIHEFTIDEVE